MVRSLPGCEPAFRPNTLLGRRLGQSLAKTGSADMSTPYEFFRIIGPFRTSRPDTDDYFRWGFICHRTDEKIVHYLLVFNQRTRRFSAVPSPNQPLPETAHPEMFLQGRRPAPIHGKITEILRSMLEPADIASMTRAAMTVRRAR